VLTINGLDLSKAPVVRVYLSDLDGTLTPIADRKPQHYRLVVDAVPQTGADKLERFQQVGEPVALTLVIQVSPALKEVLVQAVDAAKRIFDSLPAGSKIGLVAYTNVVVQNVHPGPAAAAKEAADSLRIRDDAAEVQLPDAIKDAIEGLDDPRLPKQRYIAVLSDGLTADLTMAHFVELGRRAQDKGIIVHAVGFATLEPARLLTLQELTKASDGIMREAKNAEEVSRRLAAVAEQILNQNVLQYRLAATFFDGKIHELLVETPTGETSKALSLELPKLTIKAEGKAWYKTVWFLVVVLGVAQVGLVMLVLVFLRARARPRTPLVTRPRPDDDEDEEDEEEREDEDEDEAGDKEEERERDDGDRRESREPRRTGQRSMVSERGERSSVERRALDRTPRPARTVDRASGSRAAYPQPDESHPAYPDDDVTTEAPIDDGPAKEPRRGLEALFAPDPALFNSSPDLPAAEPPRPTGASRTAARAEAPHADAPDTEVAPPTGLRKLVGPARNDTAPNPSFPDPSLPSPAPGGGFRLPLPDPNEFLSTQDAGAPEPAKVRRGGAAATPGEVALPDPEEFLRKMGALEPASGGRPARPELEALSLPQAGRPGATPAPGAASVGQRTGAPVVTGSGIPLARPAVVPMTMQPEAGVQPGRFVDRKTKVIAVEDLSAPDHVAWVVVLGNPPRTTVAKDGFTLGDAPGCDLAIPGVNGFGVLRLESGNYKLETTGQRGETLTLPLRDGDHFSLGDAELIFKVAARAVSAPLAAVRLEVLDGMDMGRKIPLQDGEVYTLGAHSTCDLIVRGEGVERCHAIAVRKGNQCIISDLGSKRGIGFQGQQIGFRKLLSWEEITLGNVRLVYVFEEWGPDTAQDGEP